MKRCIQILRFLQGTPHTFRSRHPKIDRSVVPSVVVVVVVHLRSWVQFARRSSPRPTNATTLMCSTATAGRRGGKSACRKCIQRYHRLCAGRTSSNQRFYAFYGFNYFCTQLFCATYEYELCVFCFFMLLLCFSVHR